MLALSVPVTLSVSIKKHVPLNIRYAILDSLICSRPIVCSTNSEFLTDVVNKLVVSRLRARESLRGAAVCVVDKLECIGASIGTNLLAMSVKKVNSDRLVVSSMLNISLCNSLTAEAVTYIRTLFMAGALDQTPWCDLFTKKCQYLLMLAIIECSSDGYSECCDLDEVAPSIIVSANLEFNNA